MVMDGLTTVLLNQQGVLVYQGSFLGETITEGKLRERYQRAFEFKNGLVAAAIGADHSVFLVNSVGCIWRNRELIGAIQVLLTLPEHLWNNVRGHLVSERVVDLTAPSPI